MPLRSLDRTGRLPLEGVHVLGFPFVDDGAGSLGRAIAEVVLDTRQALLGGTLKRRVHLLEAKALVVMQPSDVCTLQIGREREMTGVEASVHRRQGKTLLIAEVEHPLGRATPFDDLEFDLVLSAFLVNDWAQHLRVTVQDRLLWIDRFVPDYDLNLPIIC